MSGATGLQPGAIFAGDFQIVRPLSSGGMGAVYVAQQLSTGRERALKVMLGELLQNDDLRKRFAQEARIGASIESDHIVEVVGAGIDASSGSPWLAMELLQGEDFAHRLAREGALSPEVVLALFEQLVHAIGAAHRKGIVHRDLKPENLFLAHSRRSGQQSVVKVLDFGIAKLLGQARTKATGAMGTPLWMAPEQTQAGKGVTPAADVWALGLIAFRALSGQTFWKAASDSDSSPMMVLREVVMDPIPAASVRSRELGGAALPVAFDAWFARCVAREPAERFQDATAMFEALRPVLSDVRGAASVSPAMAATANASVLGAQPTLVASPLAQPSAPVMRMATDAPQVHTLAAAPVPAKRPPWAFIGGGVGAAAIIGVAALMLTGSGKPRTRTTSSGEKVEVRATIPTVKASAVVATPAPRAPLPAPSEWPSDLEKVQARARAEHRRVLVQFHADWCAACQELVKNTFSDAEFRESARDLLPVRVDVTNEDAPGVRELQSKFGVTGLPVVLLLDENGDELERIEEFLPTADLLARFEDPGPPRPPPSAAPAAPTPPAQSKPSPEPKPPPEPRPLPALKYTPQNL